MASITKRAGSSKPWQVRYRDPDGKPRSAQFARKVDAQRFLTTVEADMLRGSYVDPTAGKVTFREFSEAWLASQTFDVSTRVQVESRLRVHVWPAFGDVELRAIRPSTVQAWVRSRADELAAGTVKVLLYRVAGIFNAAVEDGLIATNPCTSRAVSAPRPRTQAHHPVDRRAGAGGHRRAPAALPCRPCRGGRVRAAAG